MSENLHLCPLKDAAPLVITSCNLTVTQRQCLQEGISLLLVVFFGVLFLLFALSPPLPTVPLPEQKDAAGL